MRKIFILLAFTLSTSAFAQDVVMTPAAPEIKSKKGEPYLPVADEWAIGVSASPFLRYLGNFMSGANAVNASPQFDYASNPTSNIALFGKLMKDANTAYRVRFNVTVRSNINKAVVAQDEISPDPEFPAFTEDWQKVNTTTVVIAPGLEKRRGSTRLQGVYGGELVLALTSTKLTYEYGNPMTADFTSPTTNNFGSNLLGPGATSSTRVLEDKSGANYLAGVRGFIGVEYFFAPKISIGGEFGYMFGFQTQQRSLITTETWYSPTFSTRETKIDQYRNGGVTSLGIGLDNLSGSINLLFYF